MKTTLIIVGLFILVLSAYIVFINNGTVMLVNNSSRRVVASRIEICNHTFVAENLDVNASRRWTYKIHSDSALAIQVRFDDGKEIATRTRYAVTNGANFYTTIVVQDDKIDERTRAYLLR